MISYQYTSDGYFVGQIEDYGLLPNNATRTAPELRKGFIPRWNGKAWEQIENHTGEQGYLNDQPHIIDQYGPYPEGFLTQEEYEAEQLAEYNSEPARFKRLRIERDRRLAESDYLMLPDYLGVNDEIKLQAVAYRQALRDLPDREGAPWDGGGPETPWPAPPHILEIRFVNSFGDV